MRRYFAHLDGGEVTGLYAMVMAEVEAPLLAAVLDHTQGNQTRAAEMLGGAGLVALGVDRKSTRLNSSHVRISYAVFCLKKKKKKKKHKRQQINNRTADSEKVLT